MRPKLNATTKKLQIFGFASKKILGEFQWNSDEFEKIKNKNLLNFLLENNYTIASSCSGEGKCKKCIFNKDQLSCQLQIKTLFLQNNFFLINISYL